MLHSFHLEFQDAVLIEEVSREAELDSLFWPVASLRLKRKQFPGGRKEVSWLVLP